MFLFIIVKIFGMRVWSVYTSESHIDSNKVCSHWSSLHLHKLCLFSPTENQHYGSKYWSNWFNLVCNEPTCFGFILGQIILIYKLLNYTYLVH